MSTERYTEQEIAEIFKRAAKAHEDDQASGQGKILTLEELKEIGASAGIPEEYIARAAIEIRGKGELKPRGKFLGAPVSVSRVTDLPGPLSDEAWDNLVIFLRDTFNAKGKVTRSGSLREWTNGNLKVLYEPAASGARLRMKTRKGNAPPLMGTGLGYSLIALLMLFFAWTGKDPSVLAIVGSLMLIAGAFLFGYTRIQLPSWAEKRESQMVKVGARAIELAEGYQSNSDQTSTDQSQTGTYSEPTLSIDEENGVDNEQEKVRRRNRI